MNKKYSIAIAVGAAIIVLLIIAYFYFPKKKIDLPTENLAVAPGAENNSLRGNKESVATTSLNAAVNIKDRTLKKDGFTILVPAGWAEVNYMAGATIVANPNEENLDPALKKSGFKSYFSVTRDTMKGKTWEQAVAYVRSIVDAATPTGYTAERDGMLAGNTMHFWEADLIKDGIKFKVLVYAVRGHGDDLWILTFNTGANMLSTYSRLTAKVFESFHLL